MGQQAKALTTVQLKELSDAVFLECLTTLGKVMEWSAEQKTELARRLKTAAVSVYTMVSVMCVGP